MPNQHVEEIAKRRACSAVEARQFCLEVQALQKPVTSFESIARAVNQLSPEASVEEIATQAQVIHVPRPNRRRPDYRPRPHDWRKQRRAQSRTSLWHNQKAEYIVIDGVVERLSSWQEKEGITEKE